MHKKTKERKKCYNTKYLYFSKRIIEKLETPTQVRGNTTITSHGWTPARPTHNPSLSHILVSMRLKQQKTRLLLTERKRRKSERKEDVCHVARLRLVSVNLTKSFVVWILFGWARELPSLVCLPHQVKDSLLVHRVLAVTTGLYPCHRPASDQHQAERWGRKSSIWCSLGVGLQQHLVFSNQYNRLIFTSFDS